MIDERAEVYKQELILVLIIIESVCFVAGAGVDG